MEISILTNRFKEDTAKKKRYLGFRSFKGSKSAGDMKCPLCGKWFSWSASHEIRYCQENRWDMTRGEPKHCGATHCYDYQARYDKHVAKMASDPAYLQEMSWKIYRRKERELEQKTMGLFTSLQQRGAIK